MTDIRTIPSSDAPWRENVDSLTISNITTMIVMTIIIDLVNINDDFEGQSLCSLHSSYSAQLAKPVIAIVIMLFASLDNDAMAMAMAMAVAVMVMIMVHTLML